MKLGDLIVGDDFKVCSVTLSSCFVRVCLDLFFLSILDLCDFYENILEFSAYEVVA